MRVPMDVLCIISTSDAQWGLRITHLATCVFALVLLCENSAHASSMSCADHFPEITEYNHWYLYNTWPSHVYSHGRCHSQILKCPRGLFKIKPTHYTSQTSKEVRCIFLTSVKVKNQHNGKHRRYEEHNAGCIGDSSIIPRNVLVLSCYFLYLSPTACHKMQAGGT